MYNVLNIRTIFICTGISLTFVLTDTVNVSGSHQGKIISIISNL